MAAKEARMQVSFNREVLLHSEQLSSFLLPRATVNLTPVFLTSTAL